MDHPTRNFDRIASLVRRTRVAPFLGCLAGLISTCCIPVDRGGPGNPSPLPSGGVPPVIDTGPTANGGGVDLEEFDVEINASSLLITGMSLEAKLTVERDATGAPLHVTLRDTLNRSLAENPLSGRITLQTSSTGVFGEEVELFTLQEEQDGTITAEFTGGAGFLEDPNAFVLQAEGTIFEPGRIGVIYAVQTPSAFTLKINGDTVVGTLDLNGTPTSGAATPELYDGSFSGRRSP